jgi:hypothetical protein
MQKVEISVRESCVEVDFFIFYLPQKLKILVRESCGVEVVKIEFLLQKQVEISVRESCVEVHKFARLTPTQKAPKGAPDFFKDTYYTAPR